MAKTMMLCPFSDEPCKECGCYRGRHYYLCFCEKYRGYVAEPRQDGRSAFSGAAFKKEFKIPLRIPASAFDPFDRAMKDIENAKRAQSPPRT